MTQEDAYQSEETRLTPWHKVFQYILEELLPLDVFDIIVEYEVGKLPLKVDFIVIKKIGDVKAELPDFLFFLNDYKHTIIEYKAPKDIFHFDDFLKLIAYANLYKIKEKIEDFNSVIRVGVFNGTGKDFNRLMKRYGYNIEEQAKGFYHVAHKPDKAYLINLERIEKSDKALLLDFLSKRKNKVTEAYQLVKSNPLIKRYANYLYFLINRRDYMRLIEQDPEWAKRANWTLEEFVQNLTPELRLKGLKPAERLEGLKPEERLEGLKPEERLEGLNEKDIEAYLRKIRKKALKT